MPKLDQEIQRLIELSGKATQGEWERGFAHWGRWQLAVKGGRTLGELLNYAGLGGREVTLNEEQDANSQFIAALVNFFRAHHAELAQAMKDAERYRWLRQEGEAQESLLLLTDKHLDAAIDAKLGEGEK